MITFTRGSMIARLAALGAVWLVSSGSQVSCSSGDRVTPPDPYPDSGTGPTLTTTLVLRNAAGTETYNFGRGEIIYFELTVRNHSSTPVTGSVGNSPADYLVFDNFGDSPAWQWSEGRVTTAEAYSFTLQPGDSRVYSVNWNQETRSGAMLRPGSYRARGTLYVVRDPVPVLMPDELRSALREFTVN